MPARTFIALQIDRRCRAALAAAARTLDVPGAKIRFVAEDNIHVTLNFLGDVADADLAEVSRLASQAAAGVAPFDFGVRGIVCVPPDRRVRMIWAGVADPTGRLVELYDRLAAALATQAGRKDDRPFRPHVTLARVKFVKDPRRLRDAAGPLAGKDFGTQHAESLVVYTSLLTPAGPVYTPAAGADLGG